MVFKKEARMPPKVKIQKQEIIEAAVALVRQSGPQAINARSIAAVLDCSTQPIFSNFASMDALRLAVVAAADAQYQSYIQREIEKGEYPPYKASGMAYIRFAKEEKELFKLLYMRDRSAEQPPKEAGLSGQLESLVHNSTGFSGARAGLFHLEMWAYVHGVAAMLATGFLELDWPLISQMLTDAYMGLKKRFEEE